MKIIWRILLIVALALAGMYLGSFVGAKYLVPKGSGLAGGAMVLGYLVLGLVVFTLIGVAAAFMLKGNALRNAALIIGAPVLLAYLIFTTIFVMQKMSDREPDAAFAAAGDFYVTMERLDTSDPYLFVKMEISSADRIWTKTGPGPEPQIFYAAMTSQTLIDIRQALNVVAEMSPEEFANCRDSQAPAIKSLTWTINDAPAGQSLVIADTLEISETCLQQHPGVGRALSLVERASDQRGGKVKRK